MAVRSRSPHVYVADHGGNFNMMVPDDDSAVPERGWALPVPGLPTGAKYCTPRHVDGVSPAGDHRKAIVGDPAADLWTGVVTNFDVAGVTYDIIGYIGEKRTIFA